MFLTNSLIHHGNRLMMDCVRVVVNYVRTVRVAYMLVN